LVRSLPTTSSTELSWSAVNTLNGDSLNNALFSISAIVCVKIPSSWVAKNVNEPLTIRLAFVVVGVGNAVISIEHTIGRVTS
jgi:hypothetical protein